jgi:4-hydroxy-tetrahydrodipicolinate synthase
MQALIAAGPGVLGGCDPIAPFALLAGAEGWIWGAANVMPAESVALYELIRANRVSEAMDLWRTKMFPFNSFIWDNSHAAEYITAVKTAASLRFGDLGPSRLPQLPLGADALAALRTTLQPLDF